MKKQGLNREAYRRLWQARLTDLTESGLSQRKWCEENGIKFSTLKYWMLRANKEKRQRGEAGDEKWLAVNTANVSDSARGNYADAGITVSFGAFRIEINEGVQPDRIYSLLRVIKEL